MNFGEITLGSDGVTGMQLSGIDALADGALNSLVGGLAIAIFRSHSFSRTAPCRVRGHLHGTRFYYQTRGQSLRTCSSETSAGSSRIPR